MDPITSASSERIPRSLRVQYQPSYRSFDNWSHNHRDHQAEAIRAAQATTRGQIIMPTGTGKTRVQVALHVGKMIEMTKRGEYGIFAVAAHRLALCSQLLTSFIQVAVNAGLPFDILFVGSDHFPEDAIHCQFKHRGFNAYVNNSTSTTTMSVIKEACDRAQTRKRHVVCVSTYHSLDRLACLDHLTMCTYDEAHTIIGNDLFLHNLLPILPKVEFNYFFTATPKIIGASYGMNDIEIFGTRLTTLPVRSMIEAGETVPPKFHIIQAADIGDYDNARMKIRAVTVGFSQHKQLVARDSAAPELIGAKLLVTTSGTEELFTLHNDSEFQTYCRENKIAVIAFSSAKGCFVNFEEVQRAKALVAMNNLTDAEQAILLHIDILTEGIDLPSITGVMPFRELNATKLLQMIGRGSRLFKIDRTEIYNGTLVPMDWEGYVKPCCWIILPELFDSLGDVSVMKNTIKEVVNTYEIPTQEYVIVDEFLARQEEALERITPIDITQTKDDTTELVHNTENIMVSQLKTSVTQTPDALAALMDAFRRGAGETT
jgi:hypothetical protein